MNPVAMRVLELATPEFHKAPSGAGYLTFCGHSSAINEIERMLGGPSIWRGWLRRTKVSEVDWVMPPGPVHNFPLWDELVDYAIKAKQLSS
jgi:hypothetical protein